MSVCNPNQLFGPTLNKANCQKGLRLLVAAKQHPEVTGNARAIAWQPENRNKSNLPHRLRLRRQNDLQPTSPLAQGLAIQPTSSPSSWQKSPNQQAAPQIGGNPRAASGFHNSGVGNPTSKQPLKLAEIPARPVDFTIQGLVIHPTRRPVCWQESPHGQRISTHVCSFTVGASVWCCTVGQSRARASQKTEPTPNGGGKKYSNGKV